MNPRLVRQLLEALLDEAAFPDERWPWSRLISSLIDQAIAREEAV